MILSPHPPARHSDIRLLFQPSPQAPRSELMEPEIIYSAFQTILPAPLNLLRPSTPPDLAPTVSHQTTT